MPGRRFLDAGGPIAFAHRGGAGEAPENTVPAFEAAVGMGYRYLETDVHVSRDGVLFAFHDAKLDRVTDRRGRIGDLRSDEIRAADAGFWFTTDFGSTYPWRGHGVRVPALEELLTRWPDVFVNIDPKTDACVEPLAALIRRLAIFDRVCVGSFSDARTARVRALCDGRVCTSMGQRAVAAARLAAMWRLPVPKAGADCIQAPIRWRGLSVVDATLIRAAHRSGLAVHVWTVNAEPVMHSLLDAGVDGIMSDRPRLLKEVLVARSAWTGASS